MDDGKVDANAGTPGRRAFLAGAAALAVSGSGALGQTTPTVPPAPSPSDLAAGGWRAASDLIADLAARKVSSVELLDQAIARITKLDEHINAMVVRDFDRAREAAISADQALARGEKLPLLGLPVSVKEAFNVAGLPTTWGIPQFKGRMAREDSVVVERLKSAGAVLLGKTNVPVALADWQSSNPIYGTTNNPYDISVTPGGSSGGSAAALAAGYVALEAGSDIGGSLRTPAHYCGIYSHKPSLDLVPTRGHAFPIAEPLPGDGDRLAVVGPMARSARDLALALELIAGPDEMTEGVGYRLVLPRARHLALREFRVLLIDKHPLAPTQAVIVQALERLAERLTKEGVTVGRASPKLPDLGEATRNYMRLLGPPLTIGRSPDYYERVKAIADSIPDKDSLDAIYLRGANVGWREWRAADRARANFQKQWRELFKDWDLVLCPVMPTVAFAHDHTDMAQRRMDVDGVKQPYTNHIVWAGFATAAGLPATVAPIDRTPAGMPIGVQIVGPYLEDRTPILFAQQMERAFGGFVPPVF